MSNLNWITYCTFSSNYVQGICYSNTNNYAKKQDTACKESDFVEFCHVLGLLIAVELRFVVHKERAGLQMSATCSLGWTLAKSCQAVDLKPFQNTYTI